jgi:hypothetical protein
MVKSFAYDGNMGMYYAVSELGDPSEERKKKSSKDNFRKPLRRIELEGQIPLIFDNPAELIIKSSSKSSKYSGNIDNIPIEIQYIRSKPCYMVAKSEEGLDRAHKKALDRLIHRG